MTQAIKLPRPSDADLRTLEMIRDEAKRRAGERAYFWHNLISCFLCDAQTLISDGYWERALDCAKKAEAQETAYTKEDTAERYHVLLKRLYRAAKEPPKEVKVALPKEVVIKAPCTECGKPVEITDGSSADLVNKFGVTHYACEEERTESCDRCGEPFEEGEPAPRICPGCGWSTGSRATTASPTIESASPLSVEGKDLSGPEQCDDGKKAELAFLPAEEEPPTAPSTQQATHLFWEAIILGQRNIIQEMAKVCLQVGVGEEIARVIRNQLCYVDPLLKPPRLWALEVLEGRAL